MTIRSAIRIVKFILGDFAREGCIENLHEVLYADDVVGADSEHSFYGG